MRSLGLMVTTQTTKAPALAWVMATFYAANQQLIDIATGHLRMGLNTYDQRFWASHRFKGSEPIIIVNHNPNVGGVGSDNVPAKSYEFTVPQINAFIKNELEF